MTSDDEEDHEHSLLLREQIELTMFVDYEAARVMSDESLERVLGREARRHVRDYIASDETEEGG